MDTGASEPKSVFEKKACSYEEKLPEANIE
jgi:hypothetical protein